MQDLNARANLDKVPESRAAADFLAEKLDVHVHVEDETAAHRIWLRTRQHLTLVSVSLVLAILVAVPLGVLSARQPILGQVFLALVGIVQTFPALALLSVLIIVFRSIGMLPAIAALFLY